MSMSCRLFSLFGSHAVSDLGPEIRTKADVRRPLGAVHRRSPRLPHHTLAGIRARIGELFLKLRRSDQLLSDFIS